MNMACGSYCRFAKAPNDDGLNLSQISELERISQAYAAKVTRALRIAGFIKSIRGHKGGYVLAKLPQEIKINDVLRAMGGAIYDEKFCGQHTGTLSLCTNSVDCSFVLCGPSSSGMWINYWTRSPYKT
jgi:Rrf2 family protein